MASESFLSDNLVDLYNPTYLFPVIGVLLSGLVYIFGFNRTTKNPPTLQLFTYDKDDRKTHLNGKKERRRDGSSVESPKKPKLNQTQNKVNKVSKVNESKLKTTVKKLDSKKSTDKTDQANHRPKENKKESSKKTKELIEISSSIADNVSGGQWVEAISRKKSRKLKEEAAKSEAKKKSSDANTLQVNSKASAEAKKDESKSPDSKVNSSNKLKSTSRKQASKDISNIAKSNPNSADSKPVKPAKKTKNQAASKTNVVDSDQLGAKDQRIFEKLEKEQKVRNRRNSKSKKNGPVSDAVNETKDNVSIKTSDKITAAILANYENDANQVDNSKSKKKPQQSSPNHKNNQVNQKKSENQAKNKSSVSSTNNSSSTKPELNGGLNNVSDGKRLSASKAESPEPAASNGDVNGGEKGEFKVAQSKRQRARRE